MYRMPEKERKVIKTPQDIKIIYEDGDILVLDKPSGWVVNESDTAKGNYIIQDWIKKTQNFDIATSHEYRSGIVHRLDKETSGILLIAKNINSFRALQLEFKMRKVEKKYLALVHGKVKEERFEVNVPLGRLPWRRDRFGVLPGGRNAETLFKIVKIYEKDKQFYTLMDCFPKTGRTHQIRVHLKYSGHPIVSDDFYAGRKTARKDKTFCPRLFLHAHFINFSHPTREVMVSFESKLAEDLKGVLDLLEG